MLLVSYHLYSLGTYLKSTRCCCIQSNENSNLSVILSLATHNGLLSVTLPDTRQTSVFEAIVIKGHGLFTEILTVCNMSRYNDTILANMGNKF